MRIHENTLIKCSTPNKVIHFKTWLQRVRTLAKKVIHQHLIPYTDSLGLTLLHQLWTEFWGDNEWPEKILIDCFDTIFLPWLLFEKRLNSSGSIAANYVKQFGSRLEHEQKRFLKTVRCSEFRFYTVIDKIPPANLILQDIISREVHFLREHEFFQVPQIGNRVFALLLQMDRQTTCLGLSPYVFSNETSKALMEQYVGLMKKYSGDFPSSNWDPTITRDNTLKIFRNLLWDHHSPIKK